MKVSRQAINYQLPGVFTRQLIFQFTWVGAHLERTQVSADNGKSWSFTSPLKVANMFGLETWQSLLDKAKADRVEVPSA